MGSSNKTFNFEERSNLYLIAAAGLIVLALLSTIIVSVFVKPQSCANILNQKDYACVLDIATLTNNLTACSSLPVYYADQCYGTIAVNTSNAKACMQISDPNDSQSCTLYIANQTMNMTLCTTLPLSLANPCIQGIASSQSLIADCNYIKDAVNRTMCVSSLKLQSALLNNNKTACSSIPLNGNLNDTFTAYGDVSTKLDAANIDATQLLSYIALTNQTIGVRDFCYTMLAYKTSSNSYCAYVSSPETSFCNFGAVHFATPKSNVTGINSTQFMEFCQQTQDYSDCNSTLSNLLAYSARNVSTCKSLSAQYAPQCYYTLAQIYGDSTYCSYIKNQTINSQCIIAIQSGNRMFNATS